MRSSLLRILALIRKEFLAVLKDPRSRFIIFLPPILQCLIFGYAASFDLNSVPYAVLDQDHSAASSAFLSHLDGSGIFRRQADLDRAEDISAWIDSGRALLVIQIDQNFERHLLAGEPAQIQVIADGRNSNTAGTALGYFASVVEDFNANWRANHGQAGPPVRTRHPLLVQPQSGFALEHDPEPDRHADDDGHADAHGDVSCPRARTGNI